MSENILVVEYEPRYTDRVRQALAGQPFVPAFARDGEEAIRALDDQAPKLIVLSSVVPKISTAELIRAIRGRKPLQDTPILLTVSGYTGKSPKLDAQRLGASDILPKPYSESEFLGKIQQMLGVRGDVTGKTWAPELDPEFAAVRTSSLSGVSEGQLTSNEIFGDLLDDDRPASTGAKKTMKPKDDLDKMLADTLAGVMPVPRKTKEQPLPAEVLNKPQPAPAPAPAPPPPPAAAPKPAPAADAKAKPQSDFDKRLNDTLSGLGKSSRPPAPAAPPAAAKPAAAPAPQPQRPASPPFQTEKMKPVTVDKMPIAQPVLAKTEVPREDEEEPKDGIKFGQYVLLEKIATGGMAEVWKARMRGVEGFQKIVAIKKILPHLSDNQDFIEMFIDEAKLAAQLNHNNIIHIYDLGKIQSSYYIAMEYIDGADLKTILRRGEERGQPIQVELALFIASKIASALDYAHRKHDFEGKEMGLVHRDVSPQNVLISQEGDIKLCDFGIAKAASKASHTQAGALKGKLQYMSPEQAWGRHIDKRSDIFALATVLFEMLTGRKLFTGDNELSILEQVREARVATPSEMNDEVTPEIDRIVQKALQKDAANRYQTAGEMARDLDAVLYNFRPTPTSADLAIYMHRIWSPEPLAHEPEPAPAPAPAPAPVKAAAPVTVAAPMPVPAAPPAPQPQALATPSFASEEPAKKAPIVPIAIAAIVVVLIGIGWFVMKGKSSAPATTTPATASGPATTTAPATTASTGSVVPSTTAAGTTQAPVLDPTKVEAEVQKRLAADRLKMEQQAKAQQPATATTAPAQRPTPAQVAQAAPPPVTETHAPAPQPVVQAPPPVQPPVTETHAPAPQQAAPAAPTYREGDLVPAGTEGLTPGRMIHRGTVPYPPVAKLNRVEGTVVLSVLVGETGKVLEVRVIRPITRPVGLNEAAEEIVRRSTFSAPTKDGIKVKAWTTVPVEFKL